MNNEYPEITEINPHEPGETPDGYVKMPIPFVGIYQSLLGADIDCNIDEEIEYHENQGLTIKEIKIHYDDIYKSIALYTAKLLRIEGAIYAGTVCPKNYNFSDDQPYLFVPEKFYVEHFRDSWKYPSDCEYLDVLSDLLWDNIDPWYLDEYGGLEGEYIARAVYAQWANGINSGYEEIIEALEIIS
jgi:hypothetical protein